MSRRLLCGIVLPPISRVTDAHERVMTALATVDDRDAAQPSRLPGWNRAHVVAHLADNAAVFTRLTEAALRGELVDMYPGGQAERDARIEELAQLRWTQLRDHLREQTHGLEHAWSRCDTADWATPVRFRNGTLADTVFCRWREVWIHLVDCGLDVTPGDWPTPLAEHVVTFLRSRVPPSWALESDDTGSTWPEQENPRAGTVRGQLRPLAAWIAGRPAPHETLPSSDAGRLPELGPWPPSPTPLY